MPEHLSKIDDVGETASSNVQPPDDGIGERLNPVPASESEPEAAEAPDEAAKHYSTYKCLKPVQARKNDDGSYDVIYQDGTLASVDAEAFESAHRKIQ